MSKSNPHELMHNYFNDVESYLGGLRDYRIVNVSGIQEGDKSLSRAPVGGRYYKEFMLEHTGVMREPDWKKEEEYVFKADELKSTIFAHFDGKYFNTNQTPAFYIHAGCENAEQDLIWVRPHCVPEPE